MWHRPQLMIVVADLLLLAAAAALLVAGALWATRLPLFPLREAVVVSDLHELQRKDIERALAGLLRGNFFSVNLDTLRQSLEKLPWVRHAELRRRWPAGIEISIEEHRPAAYWGENAGQLVNTYGEVFSAAYLGDDVLPVLAGPAGTSAEALRRYGEFTRQLAPTGHRLAALTVSPRLAWQVRLDDGLLVDLGREQAKAPIAQRLARFVDNYAMLHTAHRGTPVAVDMRYPNGFALRYASSVGNESRGRE
ncbi:cell division protein FtsQ/DivIB [Rhodocyclus gracilis]|uniref:Cell division protein FtsQ n=1 Tax=Rhodocyclus tenuis TaxID=1066 RepID=A0A6L5K194_RHOTE|nr:cell division protein FtsQ/DivIB [Rhodocyclus gracilis]MQY52278.1 FtsQ-type POTRA domain-containing protein [Rhodocyclus gracilis]